MVVVVVVVVCDGHHLFVYVIGRKTEMSANGLHHSHVSDFA